MNTKLSNPNVSYKQPPFTNFPTYADATFRGLILAHGTDFTMNNMVRYWSSKVLILNRLGFGSKTGLIERIIDLYSILLFE